MQQNPEYQNVTKDVCDFLRDRIEACRGAGIPFDRLLIDPGFGFGKTLQHNLDLLRDLALLQALDLPILVGVSRKSMIGKILNNEPSERLAGGVALATLA